MNCGEALMRIRELEQPVPSDEPAPGYFAPPPYLVVGNEWRLIQQLRDAAVIGDSIAMLTDAVVAECQPTLVPAGGYGARRSGRHRPTRLRQLRRGAPAGGWTPRTGRDREARWRPEPPA